MLRARMFRSLISVLIVNMHNLTKTNEYSVMLMSIPYFMQIIRVLLKLVQTHRHVMADDLYVIEVLVAELDVVCGDVVELLVDEVVDLVVDEEMELVVGVMAFAYDPYRMICFLTLLWIFKICIFISSTLSISSLKYTVNTYIYTHIHTKLNGYFVYIFAKINV